MDFKNIPDPNVDWDNIRYNSLSDNLRPEMGFRYCTSCFLLYAVNSWNFNKNKNSPDGYSYICKKCNKEYLKNNKSKKGSISPTSCEGVNQTPNQNF